MLKIDNLREFTDFNFTICDKAHGSFLITFFSAGEEENSACVLMYCSHLCTEKKTYLKINVRPLNRKS